MINLQKDNICQVNFGQKDDASKIVYAIVQKLGEAESATDMRLKLASLHNAHTLCCYATDETQCYPLSETIKTEIEQLSRLILSIVAFQRFESISEAISTAMTLVNTNSE